MTLDQRIAARQMQGLTRLARGAGPSAAGACGRIAARLGLLLPSIVLVAGLAAGVALRFAGLPDQILGGDELHAVREALSSPLSEILTSYRLTGSSPPLTALDRLLLDRGLRLDEMLLRLPSLAAGLLLLALPLWAMRGRIDRATRIFWLWLGAASPLLALYSGIARSYLPMVLAATAAAGAFWTWWEGWRSTGTVPAPREPLSTVLATPISSQPPVPQGPPRDTGRPAPRQQGETCGLEPPAARAASRRTGARRRRPLLAGLSWVALATLAVWLHLGAACLVVSPLLFAAGDTLAASLRASRRQAGGGGRWRPGRGDGPEPRLRPPRSALRGLLGPVAAGGTLALACCLFLVPARASLVRLIAAKHQTQVVPVSTWWRVLGLQAGTASLPLAALFWLAALAGLAVLLRRELRLALYLLVLIAGHVVGLRLLSPLGLASELVLDRYLLPVLPLVLLCVAAGLAAPWWPRQSRPGKLCQRLAGAGVVAALAAGGPFADPSWRESPFLHSNDLVDFVRVRPAVPAGELPRPYLAFGGGAVAEAPWPPAWDFGRALPAYQEIHGLRVLVVPAPGELSDPRLRLRNMVPPEPAALAACGARYVAVHLSLPAEDERLKGAAPRPVPPAVRRRLRDAGEELASALAGAWGRPDYASGGVLAWDLARLRRRGGRATGAGTSSAAVAASPQAAAASPRMNAGGR